jgi:hypothetical protein
MHLAIKKLATTEKDTALENVELSYMAKILKLIYQFAFILKLFVPIVSSVHIQTVKNPSQVRILLVQSMNVSRP